MSINAVNPALIATVVEQVIKTLQTMSLSASPQTLPQSNNDSDEAVLADFVELGADDVSVAPSPSLSPTPSPVPYVGAGPEVDASAAAAVTATHVAAPTDVAAPANTTVTTANAAHETWYMVSTGHAVGVFRGWHIVKPLVVGVSGACFKKYPSKAAALAAFSEAQEANAVTIVA
ncbi:hypothetical protein JOM56_014146 [Amanita muscaria]